ncbi:ATP-binding protein [Streptomyces sp. NBC_01136]|uniref:ATP-binding protein n=1 Tax=Streptomyces sp. NBC_01136 TaxID=2903754 RepID=UPI00386E09B8|nr:ATP-binding protein [Streptomyces sp. NBC_01136]
MEPTRTAAAATESRLFAMQFTSSPRGARLARQLTVRRMAEWGYPPSSDPSGTVSLLVAELAANAVRHGHVPGRDFHLRIALDVPTRLIRIEVADASARQPRFGSETVAGPEDESGRGLLLVAVLAVRWGTAPRTPVGKTVWAEVVVDAP